ncbi:Uncharacterised protein [Mycobacteroides abscessus subsp. abscessus]|nr:Uncharacterised protein [Mycobacteroides abscessus subsp. abscessus]
MRVTDSGDAVGTGIRGTCQDVGQLLASGCRGAREIVRIHRVQHAFPDIRIGSGLDIEVHGPVRIVVISWKSWPTASANGTGSPGASQAVTVRGAEST